MQPQAGVETGPVVLEGDPRGELDDLGIAEEGVESLHQLVAHRRRRGRGGFGVLEDSPLAGS